jgi:hypothetical protein
MKSESEEVNGYSLDVHWLQKNHFNKKSLAVNFTTNDFL